MVHVRLFKPEDATAVATVILSIQQGEFDLPITLEAQPDLGDIPGYYQRDLGNFWVAEVDGRIVGTIGLLDLGRRQAALRKMFVAAPVRGSTLGVASRLLQHLLAWSVEHELAAVFLGTTAKFLAAHRFYEKNGFIEIAPVELPVAFPIMAVDTKFYQRSLRVSVD